MKRWVGIQSAAIVAATLFAAETGVNVAQSAAPGTPPPGDCCSPEAMKRIAGSLGFIDVAGIKLGMTPEQAFAAVKAFNPKLKIDIINARLEPGDAPGTFKRVPQFAVAHTVGPVRNPYDPIRYDALDGSSDAIVMEFTIPPSPPLVGQISRTVTFPQGQPVAAANLVTALQKKYGQEVLTDGETRVWAFDESGKPLTRRMTAPERTCLSGTGFDPFGYGSGIPSGGQLDRDWPGGVSLNTVSANLSREKGLLCRPLIFAVNLGLGDLIPPDSKMPSLTVTIDSPALLYASRQATSDWLRAQRDGKAKSEDNAAEKRAAPKL